MFWNCLKAGHFPTAWKKANVALVHKNGNKQILSNYRPVSLLPICSKPFEKIIFDIIFQHLTANKLLNPNQSGFMCGDSCIHQLISIIHEIYASSDANPSLEVRGVFLDISKAFDGVWHEELIYKIKCIGVKGDLLALIESFLFERQQRVVLNEQKSEWLTMPQGSIFGPLFFLFFLYIYIYIYISDLSYNLEFNVKLFADDTSVFLVVRDPINTSQKLNNDLHKVSLWAYKCENVLQSRSI